MLAAVEPVLEGLNVLQAPNEGGKSTWCAFLRAMFYGVPTRERDTRTTLAEKNRYAPWSGSPMAGEVALTWGGRDITLRRFQKGSAPFAGFEAVDDATGEPVPGLTGETCGELLLGVGREVYRRSAFVGQSGLPIDADPELERRIAALVSSGEEDVSFSETEKTLKNWLNRRKHNKTGLIPKLEEEQAGVGERLEEARRNNRRLTEAEAQAKALEEQARALEAEQAAQKARQDWASREQYLAALRDREEAERALADLEAEAGPLPGKEALREAQGELVYLNTLNASLKEAKGQLGPARAAVDAAEAEAADPLFPDMDPDEAWRNASGDAERVRALERKKGAPLAVAGVLSLLGGAAMAAAGVLDAGKNLLFFVSAGLMLAAGVGFFLSARKTGRDRERARADRAAMLAHLEGNR